MLKRGQQVKRHTQRLIKYGGVAASQTVTLATAILYNHIVLEGIAAYGVSAAYPPAMFCNVIDEDN